MIARAESEKTALREGGALLASILREVAALVHPGISTAELDLAAGKKITEAGAVSAFLNYQPEGATHPYPAVLCTSINDEVVHGVPSKERVLKEGDIMSLDLGLSYEGYFLDHAVTVPVGKVSAESAQLIEATREALDAAVAAARPGGHTGDIGAAVGPVAKKYGYAVVKDLGGHGVGKAVHEKPFIENIGNAGEGVKFELGMVLALEPMFALGQGDITFDEDGYTCRTRDGSRAAHFEHTVLLTESGAEILTQ